MILTCPTHPLMWQDTPVHRIICAAIMAAVALPCRYIAMRLLEHGYDSGCPDLWASW